MNLFININGLIIISYIICKLSFYVNLRALQKESKNGILLNLRIVFICSLFLPILFFQNKFDTARVPTLNYSNFNLPNEIIENPKGVSKDLYLSSSEAISLSPEVDTTNYITLFISLFVLVGLFKLWEILKQFLLLNRIIKSSVVYKKKNNYKIILSSSFLTPFTFLNFNGPVVVIPYHLTEQIETFYLALQHENQHIRQKDIHWSLILEILKIFFWFNPGIYLWSSLLKEFSELSCDEQVIIRKNHRASFYGHSLIDMAQKNSNSNNLSLIAGMAANNRNSSFLLRRIKMLSVISDSKISKKRLKTKIYFLLCLLVSISFLTRVQANYGELSTHPKLQILVDQILKQGIKKAEALNGFAVLADPNTGKIMALSSYEYKDGKFLKLKGEQFLKEAYQPFSHIKPIIAALAIEKGSLHENSLLDAKGGQITIEGKTFYDWKDHGRISLIDSVAKSSNIGIYLAAKAIGERELLEGFRSFGLGSGSHVGTLGYAKSGKIHLLSEQEKVFNLPFLANGARNIFVTPLEILQAYSVFANGGELIQPRGYLDSFGQTNFSRNPISELTAKRMKYVLLRTMSQGTGRWAQSSKYTIVGKTATGYSPTNGEKRSPTGKANRAKFIGFAPFKNPKLISLVIIDNPKGKAHGSKHAAPVVRSILNKSLTNIGVMSDKGTSSN